MALPVPPAGLPAELTSFVGRTNEVRDVLAATATARLVTLTGPGGVGKSRLAGRVARQVDRPTAEAPAFVALDSVAEPRLVLPTVTAALGLRDDGVPWSSADLAGYLADRRLLLVVDGCEHLLDEVARVVLALLSGTSRLHVLATSRRPLGLPGEVLVEVPPLPIPAAAAAPEDLLACDSVALLVERARAAGADIAVHAGNAATFARLCRRLEGVPLAIELAAARVRGLGLAQLLARLDDQLVVLSTGSRSVGERQRAVAATLTWSYDLCTPAEQRAWERLSVFDGGFSIEAAEHVCADDDPDAPPPFDVLAGLVDQSVLSPDDDAGSVRFRMLEIVREYGLWRLGPAGEASARARHRDWFRAVTAAARRDWFGSGQGELLDRLHADGANLRSAMRFSQQRGEPEVALAMATDIWWYWLTRGSLEEGVERVRTALATLPDGADDAVAARGQLILSLLAGAAGDEETDRRAMAAAAAVGGRSPDERTRADGLQAASYLALSRSDLAAAWDLAGRALDGYTRANDPEAVALLLQHLAVVATMRGDDAGAALAVERGLAVSVEHGEERCRQYMLIRDAEERLRRGEVTAAREAAHRSLTLARHLGHRFGALSAVELFVWIAARSGEPVAAAELLGALGALWPTMGVPATGPQPPVEGYREAVDSLGAEDAGVLAAARERGRRLSYDEVVARCLGESPAVPSEGPSSAPSPVPTSRPPIATTVPTTLTAREGEVAELVARGLTNREIAAALVISPRTAEGHVQRVLDKLGYTSRASIAFWVVERRVAATGGAPG